MAWATLLALAPGRAQTTALPQPPFDTQVQPRDVTFRAADGVTIHGDLFISERGKAGPLILLFHQGGADARGEYGGIIPRLLSEGYSVLAVDQRSGGSRFGGTNRTVAAIGAREYSYCDVYLDLEATLEFVQQEGFTGRVVAWGSSYSATLAIRLGAEQPDRVAAVLAFSPAVGDPMAGCQADPFVASIRVPLLVVRPTSETSLEAVRRQTELLAHYGREQYVAENGVHGSSTLAAERVRGSVEPHWQYVVGFLRRVTANP